jgi:metal-responsive CopG/Arc/MetJ family transcriptional regulator
MSFNQRKLSTVPPPAKVTLTLPQAMLDRLDAVRGDHSRNAWIRDAIKTALYYGTGKA